MGVTSNDYSNLQMGQHVPWYELDADYNTNAKSFADALARNNRYLKLFTDEIIRLNSELVLEFGDLKDATAETIKQFNDRLDGIKEEMKDFFNQWLEDGVLDEVINVEILNKKADLVDLERTISLLSDVEINVKNFGVKGDGVTDDTDAIQAVLNIYKRVFFPKGNYKTTKPLLLRYDNMTIKGNGLESVIIGVDKSFPIFNITATRISNTIIEDIVIRNGNYGLYKETTGIMERSHFEKVWFEFQSVCGMSFKAPAQFMVNNLVDVVFRYCTGGIFLSGGASNLNTYTRVRFEGLDAPSVRMSNLTPGSIELGGSANYFDKCRFEAHNPDIQGYNPVEILNGDFNTKFNDCYFENVITPVIRVDTFPQNSRLFHLTDCHFSGNTPKGALVKFSAGIRGAIIENNHMANDGGNGAIEGATLSSDICIRNNQYLTSVTGFNTDAFTFNDIGQKINKDIALFDRKFFHATRAGLKMSDATGTGTIEPDDLGNIAVYPLGVKRATFTKDGYLELPSAGRGLKLLSPNGTRYRLTISDTGIVTSTPE